MVVGEEAEVMVDTDDVDEDLECVRLRCSGIGIIALRRGVMTVRGSSPSRTG